MADKIYEVTTIYLLHLYLEAKETDLSADDVEESELWDISDLGEFCVRLVNRKGKADIVDMAEWKKEHGL